MKCTTAIVYLKDRFPNEKKSREIFMRSQFEIHTITHLEENNYFALGILFMCRV